MQNMRLFENYKVLVSQYMWIVAMRVPLVLVDRTSSEQPQDAWLCQNKHRHCPQGCLPRSKSNKMPLSESQRKNAYTSIRPGSMVRHGLGYGRSPVQVQVMAFVSRRNKTRNRRGCVCALFFFFFFGWGGGVNGRDKTM